ncbi:MAG: M3 family metallopeptidase, partial [Ruminococcus flavefaciens]|nr:M3 family metallopeptidase [Ruminococcus flavefaciens]
MKRSEVKTRYKWRVEDVFSTDEEWEKCFKETETKIDFSKYSGKLGDANALLQLLKENDAFNKSLTRLAVYAQMRHDEDTSIAKYNTYYSKVGMLDSKYAAEFAFFEPEMAQLEEDYVKALIADSRFSDYDYALKRVLDRKPHVISVGEEKLIGMSGEIFSSFYEIFNMMDYLELPLPEIDWEGKSVKLSHGLYGVILHSEDRKKRKEAYEKYYAAYISLINTITATYYGNIKTDVLLSKVYKYGSSLERALASEDVDRKVYDNLLTAVNKNLPSMHRYIGDRKKILGYDKLYFYDMYAPLVSGADLKLSYDEAYEYVIKGLEPLGKEYQALLKRGYDERWLDVEETDGKANGAYSI